MPQTMTKPYQTLDWTSSTGTNPLEPNVNGASYAYGDKRDPEDRVRDRP